jgi:hypothetical protein
MSDHDALGEHAAQQGWTASRTAEAREVLDELPPADRLPLVTLVKGPHTTPELAIAMLRHVAAMSVQDRRRVITLVSSEDARDRSLARTLAARLPPVPDPRLALLEEARTAVRKAIRLFPNDPEVPALTAVLDTLVAIDGAITARVPR